jgi:hypothetical protein
MVVARRARVGREARARWSRVMRVSPRAWRGRAAHHARTRRECVVHDVARAFFAHFDPCTLDCYQFNP